MHWLKETRAFKAVPLGSATELQLLPTQRTTWHFPTPSRPFLQAAAVHPRPAPEAVSKGWSTNAKSVIAKI